MKNQDYRFLFLREDIKEMEKSNIMIRLEKKEEYQKVENLVRESFWNVYRPGCLEHYVLHQLRNDLAFVPELDFVMFLNENGKEDKLIGQNMFMRTSIIADDGRNIPIMTMGPICITPELKRQGYGKVLLDYSLDKATQLGCGAVCFEGNIDFYGKSGFKYASEFNIRYHGLPEGEDASFFLSVRRLCQFLFRLLEPFRCLFSAVRREWKWLYFSLHRLLQETQTILLFSHESSNHLPLLLRQSFYSDG